MGKGEPSGQNVHIAQISTDFQHLLQLLFNPKKDFETAKEYDQSYHKIFVLEEETRQCCGSFGGGRASLLVLEREGEKGLLGLTKSGVGAMVVQEMPPSHTWGGRIIIVMLKNLFQISLVVDDAIYN